MPKRAAAKAKPSRVNIERRRIADFLKNETVSGGLILAAAGAGFILANSPLAGAYDAIRELRLGPHALHLDLTVQTWAADALLALFFFVVGVELKHEFLHGSLAKPSRAVIPIAAALGGMIVPAGIFLFINAGAVGGSLQGWGIPMATDIAFALAVLSLFGRRLPLSLRAFLLTLAIVDDLGAIAVIALFYSSGVQLLGLLGAAGALLAFWAAQRARIGFTPLYLALASLAWFGIHESGVHATVAGVLLGFCMRSVRDAGERRSPAERAERAVHPWSAGLAVPLFAFTAAGVSLQEIAPEAAFASPIFSGVVAGLLFGKPIGIYVAARIAARIARSGPPEGTEWRDVGLIGIVAGIGFTVSLLIAKLAFEGDQAEAGAAKLGVLVASLLAAALAGITLTLRSRRY
jgi:NhaA family Na+:H+ antiporter